MDTVFIHSLSTDVLATVCASWDDEGTTVSCSIGYPHACRPESNALLREALDEQFHIASPSYVVTAGTLTLSLDAERRLVEFDLYTNATKWVACELESIEGTPSVPCFTAPFDALGRTSEDKEPSALYDATTGTLCLSWGSAEQWLLVALTLQLGLATDGRLMQTRMGGIFLPRKGLSEASKPLAWLTAMRPLARATKL